MQSSHFSLALKAAKAGAEAILNIYKTEDFGVEMKSDDSPLTRADQAAHNAIVHLLGDTGIPILSEEGKHLDHSVRKDWDQCWIVDPLDGTKEFIKRNGEFTVNIALIEKGIPTFGIVWVPVSGEVFLGEVGNGAFKFIHTHQDLPSSMDELKAMAQELPLELPSTFTMVGSRSHMSPETESYMNEKRKEHGEVEIVSKGSSLKLCMVAEGKAHEYPRFAPTMEWDTAAGQAVCMASGAEVLRWPELSPLKYNREELLNPWFLVRRK